MNQILSDPECISQEKVEALIADGIEVVFIDVRSESEYNSQHIDSAIHIPVEVLTEDKVSYDYDSVIITTCGKGGGRSTDAAIKLQEFGYPEARWLCGGTIGWYS